MSDKRSSGHKVCSRCGVDKLLADFTLVTRAKSGYAAHCKECNAALARGWRMSDPERSRSSVARYKINHPDRVRATQQRSYERRLPDIIDYQASRRALKAGVAVEVVYRAIIWERDNGICGICLEPADPHNWHLDHIIPLSRGGEHSYVNTRVSHPPCNTWKTNRLDSELPQRRAA